ncbi:hypothetical protein QEN19_004426 [Hanseniaspora menglaensis]
MLLFRTAVFKRLRLCRKCSSLSMDIQRYVSTKSHISEITFGDEQKKLIDLIVNKEKSVFFTGAAGTGKSVVLREVIRQLKTKYPRAQSVAVTASTGLAGLNIGGRTYQSYLGLGLGMEPVSDLVQRIKKSPKKTDVWLNCKVLIIDEVSMVDAKMITKISHIGKYFKKNMEPFGGIQLVFVGDFYQLPPVSDQKIIDFIQSEDLNNNTISSTKSGCFFAFESEEWKKAIDYEISLTKIYRQASDPTFIKMLNEVRVGEISNETDLEFKKLCLRNFQESKENLIDGSEYRLNSVEGSNVFPTRNETNKYNRKRLNTINATPVIYDAYKTGTLKGTREYEMINESIIVPDELTLKKGSQVMLVKNQSSSLVNGSLGYVVDFVSLPNYEHFEKKGTGNGIFDFLFDMKDKVKGNPNLERKVALRKQQQQDTEIRCLPLVKFVSTRGKTVQYKIISPEFFEYKDIETDDILFSKKQIPLILAWALSVHKSQGQTYHKLNCDLSRIFEDGQAYVALSRVTSREGLQLKNWNKDKVQINPVVKAYYKSKVKPVDNIINHNPSVEIFVNDAPTVVHNEENNLVNKKNNIALDENQLGEEIDFVDNSYFKNRGRFKSHFDEFGP